MWTSDDALKELVVRDFHPIPIAGSEVQPECILYTRAYDEPFMDEVIIRGEDDATSCRRLFKDGVDLSERRDVVWLQDGSVAEVVDKVVFHLPHPARPGAPTRVITAPGNLWLPPSARNQLPV